MAVWSTAYKDSLNDSCFAYIESGGTKDEGGKTTPRSKRHFPYKDKNGKLDAAHVRDGLSRLPDSDIPDAAKASVRRKLVAAAKKLGIEVADDDDNVTQERQTVEGSYEDRQEVLRNAILRSYADCDDDDDDDDVDYVWLVATTDDTVTWECGGEIAGYYQATYEIDANGDVKLGETKEVNVSRTITPKSATQSATPAAWLTQEAPLTYTLPLTEGRRAVVVQEATESTGGKMRVRIPFYVGNSESEAPGFKKPIFWPENSLPGIIQAAEAQLTQGQQPLTVYARHAHATDRRELPIGAVVGVEREGSVGYAELEILPTVPHGQNAQMLADAGHLNAVSLRSTRFQLRDGKVNGAPRLICEGMAIDGIDFAPDGPAQPTFGLQILSQEAVISDPDPAPTKNINKRNHRKGNMDEVTLENVPADVREQIEAPLRAQLAAATKERDELRQEKNVSDRNAYLREIASKCGDPETGFETLVALCEKHNATTREAAAPHVTPYLLQALEAARTNTAPARTETVEERAAKLFGGQTVGGKGVVNGGEQTAITQEADTREYISGLPLPVEA